MSANDVRTTFIMPYVQYKRAPYRVIQQYFEEVPMELEPHFKDILMQDNLQLEAEMLRDRQVHFTITHSEFGDYDGILEPNGPKVPEAIADMLRRFNVDEYQKWLKAQGASGG